MAACLRNALAAFACNAHGGVCKPVVHAQPHIPHDSEDRQPARYTVPVLVCFAALECLAVIAAATTCEQSI